jgi:hypothetical protein
VGSVNKEVTSPTPNSPDSVFISLLGDDGAPGCFSNIHKEQ